MFKSFSKKDKVIISLSLLLLISSACWGYQSWKSQQATLEYETKVNAITEIDYSDRQDALNEVVEDGKINIQYTIGAIFNGKVSESFNVKNNINNHYPMIFEIYDPDGNCIYTSKMIEPGYEINSIELEKELPKGIHECKIKMGYATSGNVSSLFPIKIEVK